MSEKILASVRSNPSITVAQLAVVLGVAARTVERGIAELRKFGVLRRIGGKKGGKWEVVQ